MTERTREELVAERRRWLATELAALERPIEKRITVVRIYIDKHGNEIARFTRHPQHTGVTP